MSFEERINAIVVKGAFEQLLAAGWTPSVFAEAYGRHHDEAKPAPASLDECERCGESYRRGNSHLCIPAAERHE